MALTLRGSAENSAIDGGSVTVTHPVGIAQDDVVYVAHGIGNGTTDLTLTLTTTGYTKLIELFGGGTTAINLAVWRKIMGATPDSTAVCDGTGGAGDTTTCVEHVWTGADTGTPEDATTVGTTNTTADPNSPSIVTVTDNAIVLSLVSKDVSDATVTAPTGYSNKIDINATDTNSSTTGVASISKTPAGTEDPPVWTGFAAPASDVWAAATVAIRPAAGAAASILRQMMQHGLFLGMRT